MLEFVNPEKGVAFGELFISDLTANDFDVLLRSLSAKFRNDEFFERSSLQFDLAAMTFEIAKEAGISSERFKKLVRDFVENFKYGINNWQPDDILKLSEMPRLYPYDWVMKQHKDDPRVWNKVQGYEVGDEVLYAWKWEEVPLKKFVPKQQKVAEMKRDVEMLDGNIPKQKTIYSIYKELEKENISLRAYIAKMKQELEVLKEKMECENGHSKSL